jgi:hypothetical protein
MCQIPDRISDSGAFVTRLNKIQESPVLMASSPSGPHRPLAVEFRPVEGQRCCRIGRIQVDVVEMHHLGWLRLAISIY